MPSTRAVVALTADGYTQDEIVEMLGEASVRAVEGVLWTNDATGRMRGQQQGWAQLTGQNNQ